MNKYEIKGIVGEGAYGIVYQARHKETGEIGKLLIYFLMMTWLLFSRYKKVQRERRRWHSEEDNLEGSKNAQEFETREHRLTQRVLQKVMISLMAVTFS